MRKIFLPATISAVLMSLLCSCSTTPKASSTVATPSDAKTWLNQYCSKINATHSSPELMGSLIMKARTQEFKGQYPASLHFEPTGAFQLEITNILGGTLVQLIGDQPGPDQSLEVKSPSKPRYNRKGITHYLGLEVSVLTQLLHGDLPCPPLASAIAVPKKGASDDSTASKVTVDGPKLVIETANWRWVFQRASLADQQVPIDVQLLPQVGPAEGKTIDMQIEDWDRDANYAKKVYLKTPEGELHWAWRSREQK